MNLSVLAHRQASHLDKIEKQPGNVGQNRMLSCLQNSVRFGLGVGVWVFKMKLCPEFSTCNLRGKKLD